MSENTKRAELYQSLCRVGIIGVSETQVGKVLNECPELIERYVGKIESSALSADDRHAIGLLMACSSEWVSDVLRDVGIKASLSCRFEAVMTTPRLIEVMGQFESGRRSVAPAIKVAFFQRSLFSGLAEELLKPLSIAIEHCENAAPTSSNADRRESHLEIKGGTGSIHIQASAVGTRVAVIDVPKLFIERRPVSVELCLNLLRVLVGVEKELIYAWSGPGNIRLRLAEDQVGFGIAISVAGELPLAIGISTPTAVALAKVLSNSLIAGHARFKDIDSVMSEVMNKGVVV